jgi:hypothetical protein
MLNYEVRSLPGLILFDREADTILYMTSNGNFKLGKSQDTCYKILKKV